MDYGLARVSRRDQNPQLQLDALNAAGCWPIVEEKVSGVSEKRPVRDEVLRQLRRGDTLTVWKLDRLGRSVIELHQIIDSLDRREVRFRCLTQQIDTSTNQGRFFFTLLAAFAEFERELIVERTVAGLEAARERGRVGGPPPYGLAADGSIIEAEAAVLREAGRRALAGEPLAKIVDYLNDRGIRPRHSDRWHVTTLRRQLTNPRAVPILGHTTHSQMVRLFGTTEQQKRDRQRFGPPAEHLLSGILRCGREGCGQPMYWGSFQDPRGGARRLNYICKRSSGGRFAGCSRTVISAPRADAWATEAFIAAVCSDEFADALNRRRAELLADEVTAAQVEEWRAELAELEQVLPTRFAADVHRARHAELQWLVRQATAGLLQRPDLQALLDLPKSEAKLRATWDGWTIPERRVWLRRVLEHITVLPAPPGTHHRGSDVDARMVPKWKV
jgi:DNA invertase Pin-like site-specific DNA recombinase